MKTQMVPIDKIIPYARNARKIPQIAIDKVAASIKEFGWQQAIVVDTEYVILAGHTRLLAAQKLGLTEVPIKIADELTPQQAKAYRLADNRVATETDFDYELLPLEFEELVELGFDLALTGFDPSEISRFGGDVVDDQRKEWDDMPEFKQGDITSDSRLIVHFVNQEDRDDFARLLRQDITEKTKYLWHPEQKDVVNDMAYTDGES